VARQARNAAVGFLREVGADREVLEVVALLVSELVTNAALHAGADRLALQVDVDGDHVRFGVRDPDPQAEVQRQPPSRDRIGGHGLVLVDHLASRWGVDREPDAKTVWFELPLA
jgi:anti-sigma regulatory factor (Ser/Thr protein kinase)